jgi:hypothetical protein
MIGHVKYFLRFCVSAQPEDGVGEKRRIRRAIRFCAEFAEPVVPGA